MTTSRKNGSKSEGRKGDGTFAAGNPGKPKGARHKVTRAVEELLEGQGEALTKAAIAKALDGDTVALRLCLERIAPARKDAAVSFDLPKMETIEDAAQGAQAVLAAVARGDITPAEGAAVMGLIDGYRRTLEATEIEARLTALEDRAA